VRESLGWIPLVTPTSQIVGTQAMLNVKFGRWKMISQPAMDIALGKYGRAPGPIDPEVLKDVVKRTGQDPIEGRAADLLEPRMEKLKAELRAKNLPDTDENAVLYAMFPQETEKVIKGEKPTAAAPAPVPANGSTATTASASKHNGSRYVLNIDGKRHEVTVEEVIR
jgi:oxaloacetate decarboxylase alpha subunit/pyruvate carboxylase subunit B